MCDSCETKVSHNTSRGVGRGDLLGNVEFLLPSLQRAKSLEVFQHLSAKEIHRREHHERSLCCKLAARMLSSHRFDLMMGIVIVFNVVTMVIDIDRSASDEEEARNIHWTDICGWVVLTIFALELFGRLCVFQYAFWRDSWNVFDFFLVTTDVVFSLIGLVAVNLFPVSVLRIFRLAKLARVSKVLRVFPELRLLLAALIHSMTAIFWGAILLFLTLLMWSMIAVLFINPLNKTLHYDGCERCPRAYSSVSHAMLTFTQQTIAGDSWGQTTIPLVEAHPSTIPFFAGVLVTVGLAVLNLIVGVVVEVAQKAKGMIEEEESAEHALLKLRNETTLIDFCRSLDRDGDGYVTKKEIQDSDAEDGTFHRCLDSVGITPEDFDIVWEVMDPDYRGKVSYKVLVKHLCNMRSSDSQFMLAYIKYYITLLRNNILEEMSTLRSMEAKTDDSLALQHKIDDRLELDKKKETMQQLVITPRSPRVEEPATDNAFSKVTGEEQSRGIAAADTRQEAEWIAAAESQGLPLLKLQQSPRLTGLNFHPKNIMISQPQNTLLFQHSDVEATNWNKQFLHDLEAMRAELKELLITIDFKVSHQQILRTPSRGPSPSDSPRN